MSDNSFSATTSEKANMHNGSTGLPRPGLARSVHRGRMKLLRGYVSKSSAALNPLTITQLAFELSMHAQRRVIVIGRSVGQSVGL